MHTVFGIALGQPLAVPECPKYGSGLFLDYGYSADTCYQRTAEKAVCAPLLEGYAGIHFKILSLPTWSSQSEITARIVSGRVEGIRIYTTGISGQDEAIEELTQKYGKPSSTLNTDVQNRMGAKFVSLNASWTVGDLEIVLIGTAGRLDEGQVEIATRVGRAAFESDRAKLTQGVKPL
jgi:hypothetical protein